MWLFWRKGTLSLRCLVQSTANLAESCPSALILMYLAQNCCLIYWERKKPHPTEPILIGTGRIKMQDYPCKGLYRVCGSLTFLRSEHVWSCARVNPNACELPVSRQIHTQRVSWAVLVVTCDQYQGFMCVHLIPVLSPNSVFV